MAPASQGHVNGSGTDPFANGHNVEGPPPSTLAAQLVENISATAQSARSVETAELKRLSVVIERIKDHPELLRSTEDRIGHNNMLIYVYTRVVLEGLKWGETSVDPAHIRAEALKALEFLKVTIKEAPGVLMYRTDGSSLLFRGSEPLWAWLLPKILKLLGQGECASIAAELKSFCRYVLETALNDSKLQELSQSLLSYCRANIEAVLSHAEKFEIGATDAVCDLTLPPRAVLDNLSQCVHEDGLAGRASDTCSFSVPGVSEALSVACALLGIVAQTCSAHKDAVSRGRLLTENGPWLFDSYLSLQACTYPACEGPQPHHIYVISTVASLAVAIGDSAGVLSALSVKGFTTLVLISATIIRDVVKAGLPLSGHMAEALALCVVEIVGMCSHSETVRQLVQSELIDPLKKLMAQLETLNGSGDLTQATHLLDNTLALSTKGSLSNGHPAAGFENSALNRRLSALMPQLQEAFEAPQPLRKRRRMSNALIGIRQIPRRLCRILQIPATEDMTVIGRAVVSQFQNLSDLERSHVIQLLSGLACPALASTAAVPSSQDPPAVIGCIRCAASHTSQQAMPAEHSDTIRSVTVIFRQLFAMQGFSELKKPRILAILAIRELLQHWTDPSLISLDTSPLGQICLQSLQSKIREMRIAAGRTLPGFIHAPRFVSEETIILLKHNRATILTLLRTISEKDSPPLNETCIMAWGQLGRIFDEAELSLVLLKLLEYLGHRNMITSACAFNELLNLAEYHNKTPKQLFDPCWKTLALSAVKDMVTRPQVSMRLADLLQMSVNELLLKLQRYALPWLVLGKRKEIISKIADARGDDEPWMACLDSVNLPLILALLLCQDVPDVDGYVMSLFRFVSPYFDGLTLADLLQPETFNTTLELLKTSGEADEAQNARIRRALAIMADALTAPMTKKPRKGQMLASFMQQHALGLATRFSEVINDSVMLGPSMHERRQCIRALEEMVRIGKAYVRIARPQMSACLLAALGEEELRSVAFSCWCTILSSMDYEDVEALLEPTFFVLCQYWQLFDASTKQQATFVLENLVTKYSEVFRDTIDRLPLLPDEPELRNVSKQLSTFRRDLGDHVTFAVFSERIGHENSGVVQLALQELRDYLKSNQAYLQASALSEQPAYVVLDLVRALLDCSAKYNGLHPEICRLSAQCLGLFGCLDSNRLETRREDKQFVVIKNFDDSEETHDFVLFMLENVLVGSFLSTTDTHLQGFLSYAMQELLERCEFRDAATLQGRDGAARYRKWLNLKDATREILTPFLTSRYSLAPMAPQQVEHPIYHSGKPYGNWLRTFVLDLLHKGQNGFALLLFEPLRRVIRVKDLSIAEFLLPYVVLHVIVSPTSSDDDCRNITTELKSVLEDGVPHNATYAQREDKKQYYEAVFRVLDYFLLWKSKRQAQSPPGPPEKTMTFQITRLQGVLDLIPATLISKRSVDCKQYARALHHLEHYIEKPPVGLSSNEKDGLFEDLLDIYANIDDPDGVEGVNAHRILDLSHQILGHKKAGRWTEAQTWYEVQLAAEPNNASVQLELLTCLKESGQHDVLLNYVEGMKTSPASINRIIPFAVEASWATGRWTTLQKYLGSYNAGDISDVFNLGVGAALLRLHNQDLDGFRQQVGLLRDKISGALSFSATASLQASHEARLHCHVLSELELIAETPPRPDEDSNHMDLMVALERRLELIGAFVSDKQYLLGIRRAAMAAMQPKFANEDISSLWLSSAKLARKADAMHQSFNAVLHATKLGGGQATIENGKLLWKQGNHRKAIQILQGAITQNSFMSQSMSAVVPTSTRTADHQRNLLTARAQLLLAKWQDSAGQTNASALRERYQQVAKTHGSWEKGHYYLGRHYKKVLESEKSLKPDDQSDEFLTGETAKLVVENYLRSLNFGTKYLYQTLPRILTLWLELGAQVDKAPEGKVSLSRELHQRRQAVLADLHKQLHKNMQRMPAYIFYTALPQIVARIAHPNPNVFHFLEQIIIKVVEAHPRQALWSLFACMTTKQAGERRNRGIQILQRLRSGSRKVESSSYDIKQLLRMGEKLADQLLSACNNGDFQSNRTTMASITRDLNFNHKCTPCPLVVPIESCLTATLPTLTDNVKRHKAFSRDVITVESFLDEVLVLGSLAKPRKLTARGSDGRSYGLLLKPKDDMRTDQRLMEFNSMINRSLKRDAESSRRQLYIRTYAVTPLNEECGIIEWVEGLKTLRDILLNIYKVMGIAPNYGQIAELMKQACTSNENITLFTNNVLSMFPKVLGSWFTSQFPHPSAWLAARLRYTRSCAVMSMVGTILGLGDRHGENVLLEEGNGGVFHVDFNCLFDKGLTFAQPERVPFRLTHNMVGAMGIYGYDGPFRTCSELTLRILRQQEETLMTILEAFIYDPTLDLQKDKRRKGDLVRLNPTSVVASIKRKVRGLLGDESIPLGVEGQAEELIKQAVDPKNLSAMYIGWCPFL